MSTSLIVIGVAVVTFVSTMAGGLFALRVTTHIGLVIALGAGVRIGAAFHAGTQLGLVVALVVVLHDFSDGIGTVSVLLANGSSRTTAFRWLVADAAAPVIGALTTFALTIEGPALGALLGIFVGFFLYVGGAELLPEAHRQERSGWVMIATIFGALFIYVATRIVVL